MERRFYYYDSFALQWDPIFLPPCIKGSNALLKYVFFMLTRIFRRANMIHIHLQSFRETGTRLSIHSPVKLDGKPNFVSERRFMLPILDAIPQRAVYSEVIAGYLSTLGFHDDVYPCVTEQIYQVLEYADPWLPISVILTDVTVKVLGKSVVPPPNSAYHLVKRVRLDHLESTTRQEPCSGCRESLDHIYDAEEGITCLPCSHCFHVGCLVQCLEVIEKRVCPICSHPLNSVEFRETSKSLDWPFLLGMATGIITVSATGIITVTLLCRLLKRS